ncbi:MAG: adenylate/guanylate cyclase domain-containing protein [Chloroflexi bacterium]|nr:adenylate/guanylate cyclase domain-containing protein [Chloroflexota bacterium]
MTPRQRARLLTSLGLALASALAVTSMLFAGYLDGLQLQTGDVLFKTRPEQTEPRVVIVGIDEQTMAGLAEYGRLFTWPRSLHARVINNLREAGARVIVLDLLFDVPAPGDDELAQAIKAAGNVVSPIAGDDSVREIVLGQPLRYARSLRPLPALLEASVARGHANQYPDDDGTIRRMPLVITAQGEQVPALSLVAAARYLRRPNVLEGPVQDGYLPFAGRRIPVDELLRMRIYYLGAPARQPRTEVIPLISYLDVLQGNFSPALVKDRVVFIGTTATAYADDYWVPTSRGAKMDGVEIHAHATATIVRPAFLEEAPRGLTIGLVLLFALLVGLALFALNPIWGAAGALLVAALYLLATSFLFEAQRLILNVVYPLFGIGLAFSAVILYRVLFEQREQRVLQAVFAQYVPPAVAQEVARNPDAIKLGGERRVISVLFTDLKGFTTFSESVEPEVLSQVITEYLNAMTQVVFKYEGTVDKYIGDAVMAFWNAPQTQPDHARRACLAALEMQRELARLGEQWQQRGLPRQYMRIGINTGPVSVGNMGSALRLAYTAIGDSVNLGARLEPLNNEYGTWICLSEYTLAEAGDGLRTRYLDLVAVKGKAQPVAVYELIGLEADVTDARRQVLERYLAGIELYRGRHFASAASQFRAALELGPKDGPSNVYLQRCLDLAEDPPPEAWDGVYVMKHK